MSQIEVQQFIEDIDKEDQEASIAYLHKRETEAKKVAEELLTSCKKKKKKSKRHRRRSKQKQGTVDTPLPSDSEEDEENVCPITLMPFVHPVRTVDGHVYERQAILEWFEGRGMTTSPATNLPLPSLELVGSYCIKQLCF